jgi:hypothetical protein
MNVFIFWILFKILYRTTSFSPVALCGCLKPGEEQRLKLLENTVLRRIFGPKREEVIGERRKLNNEELHTLYSTPKIIWVINLRMKLVRRFARMGDMRKQSKTRRKT